jgi:2-C-methyl-D-erythritol 2,4-cyclodiphosphate synthase
LALLKEISQKVRNKKGRISNIDLTIIAEKPKLTDFTETMRENLRQALDVPIKVISVKCSSNNGLGFIGRGEGMACIAVCLVELEG